jgi:23S rRNA pseudouridine2605 synthase
MTLEKIQKMLANAGLGSRRQIESWIAEGRITVNGKPAEIGGRVDTKAKICIDGKPIKWRPERSDRIRVLLYHKPEGQIATRHDPQNRPTVFDDLPPLHHQRWIQIGRLDLNTSGLLIFTTHGGLANYLMHPRYEFEREYAVRILGKVSEEMIQTLKKGVTLEDGPAHFDEIRDAGGTGANHWYHVILKEGRQREVRRLWESQGVKVSRLIRVRYGSLTLPRMVRPGRYQELTPKEVEIFLEQCQFKSTHVRSEKPLPRSRPSRQERPSRGDQCLKQHPRKPANRGSTPPKNFHR